MSLSLVGTPVGEDIWKLVDSGDIVGAWEWLDGLAGARLSEAKAWFAKNRRALVDRPYDYTSPGREERDAARPGGDWVIGMCALELCGPVTAAKFVPWGSYWTHQRAQGEAALVHMLWDMSDRDWVAQFVATASDQSPTSIENALEILGGVLRSVVVHHGLPCPSGRAYMKVWLSGVEGTTLTDKLSGDALMPDLLYHHLASGDCGSTTGLPETVLDLIRLGELDRTAVLDHVISLFTSPQRPASQLMLARVFDALAPQPDEIPGGLTYLLGVIATGHGPAGRILLPYALSLIATADDLADVVAVVAGRPETKQRQLLLATIDDKAFQDRIGVPAVLAAAETLAQTDDTSIADRAYRVLKRLGSDVDAPAEEIAPSGLWDMPPTPPPSSTKSYWGHEVTWETILNRFGPSVGDLNDDDFRFAVEKTLTEMQNGQFGDGSAMVTLARRLLHQSTLGLTRLERMVPDLFLNGGLRQGWAPILAVADMCSRARPVPAGLATFLRALAVFSSEVPQQDLPEHILALAAGKGENKMQLEARVLGSRLARLPIADYLAQIRLAQRPAAEPEYVPPPVRGLWNRPVDLPPLPGEIRLPSEELDLPGLQRALCRNFDTMGGQMSPYRTGPGAPVSTLYRDVTTPDVLVAHLVRAIHREGPGPVRSTLAYEGATPDTIGVILAVELYIFGKLRVERLRELPTSVDWGRTRVQLMDISGLRDHAATEALMKETRPTLDNVVPVGPDLPLLRPASLAHPEGRVAFVWAAEVLLLAESNPTVLSTPTWADGTLDLDDLLARIREADGRLTSALDLVQALWRLRDFAPGRTTELDGITLPLAFGYTLPDGTRVSDGVDLVRLWLEAGGLPPLNAYEVEGTWHSDAEPPLAWTGCDHVPLALLDGDPWSWGWPVGTLRLMPRWPDRMIPDRTDVSWSRPQPVAQASGPLGIPIMDRWLSLDQWQGMPDKDAVDIARRGRLVPELMAAAAVSRHRAGGVLKLADVSRRMWLAFEEPGGFAGMWPSALAVAAALSAEAHKPAELGQLLRVLTVYAHEVPDPVIPEQLRAYAAGKGTSKTLVEARRLVALLGR